MFSLFKSKTDNRIYSPVEGKCVDISDVNDIAFSSKAMGDGVAIIPTNNIIKAPCNGKITMIFPTHHAFGIETTDGTEILIHIGIDTVNSNGKGFQLLKSVHDKIKKGDAIVSFDEKLKTDYDMTTMIIITNNKNMKKYSLGQVVNENTCIMERIE